MEESASHHGRFDNEFLDKEEKDKRLWQEAKGMKTQGFQYYL